MWVLEPHYIGIEIVLTLLKYAYPHEPSRSTSNGLAVVRGSRKIRGMLWHRFLGEGAWQTP